MIKKTNYVQGSNNSIGKYGDEKLILNIDTSNPEKKFSTISKGKKGIYFMTLTRKSDNTILLEDRWKTSKVLVR